MATLYHLGCACISIPPFVPGTPVCLEAKVVQLPRLHSWYHRAHEAFPLRECRLYWVISLQSKTGRENTCACDASGGSGLLNAMNGMKLTSGSIGTDFRSPEKAWPSS